MGRPVPRHARQAVRARYSIQDSYGVTRIRFEAFTLGTLAVVVVIALLGYWSGASVRAQTVEIEVELEPSPLTEPAVTAS